MCEVDAKGATVRKTLISIVNISSTRETLKDQWDSHRAPSPLSNCCGKSYNSKTVRNNEETRSLRIIFLDSEKHATTSLFSPLLQALQVANIHLHYVAL